MANKNVAENLNQENEQVTGEVVELKKDGEKVKKPNVFKRAFSAIGSGFRKVRESPVAAAIGTVVGAGAALGVKAFIDHRRHSSEEDSAIAIDDLVEIEDSGEEVIEETDEDILAYAIVDIREELKSNVKTIILPFQIDFPIENVKFEYPQKGDKGKILELANRNAKFYMLEKHKQVEGKDPEKNTLRKLETLKADLMMDELPVHIECFDNSNIQGTNPVASCVVFKNAKPSKKDYRHFNIKTVVGANDFASMEEIIFRRYRRLLDEGEPLPQLIVVDGGKVQLSFAVRSLEKLGLIGKVKIVGIAKRLEEIFLPGDDIPLYLDKNSESLKIIQHARDEAHRFGITFHRKKRSDNFLKSELDDIKGIGPKTKEILLKEFKTINGIKEASKEKLTETLGAAKAEIIWKYFHKG